MIILDVLNLFKYLLMEMTKSDLTKTWFYFFFIIFFIWIYRKLIHA